VNDILKTFERLVNVALMLLLCVVIGLTVVDLVWLLIEDILAPPLFRVSAHDLLELFGLFLLVLIGLELLETIRRFYTEGRIELRVIFTVALIALGRKIIILEPTKYEGLTMIGLGVIILALVAGYLAVANKGLVFQQRRDRSEPEES